MDGGENIKKMNINILMIKHKYPDDKKNKKTQKNQRNRRTKVTNCVLLLVSFAIDKDMKWNINLSGLSLTHLLDVGVPAGLVDELADGHEDRQNQTRSQNDEDASDVLHTQSAGLLVVLLWTTVSSPPLLLHHVELPFLLQLKDGNCDFIPVGRTWGRKENMYKTILEKLLHNSELVKKILSNRDVQNLYFLIKPAYC